MERARSLLLLAGLLAVLAMVCPTRPALAAGSLGDPLLGPDYFQVSKIFDPVITIFDPLWTTTFDLTTVGDDPADVAYVSGTDVLSAYVTLEHTGNSGPSASELWLVGTSGDILVGVLGNSTGGWLTEHWALSSGAVSAIESGPTSFTVRLGEGTPSSDSLQLRTVRVSGDVVPEPAGLLLLATGGGVVALVRRQRRQV